MNFNRGLAFSRAGVCLERHPQTQQVSGHGFIRAVKHQNKNPASAPLASRFSDSPNVGDIPISAILTVWSRHSCLRLCQFGLSADAGVESRHKFICHTFPFSSSSELKNLTFFRYPILFAVPARPKVAAENGKDAADVSA